MSRYINTDIAINKKKCSYKTLEKLLPSNKTKRQFKNCLIKAQKNKKNFIIGEIKKSSPSAGNIIKNYYPEELALNYLSSELSLLLDRLLQTYLVFFLRFAFTDSLSRSCCFLASSPSISICSAAMSR